LDYLPLLGQDGYLVRGWSHLLAGYPRSGKTELLAACCRDWLAMGERVLYSTEEPRSIWQQRLARAGCSWTGMQIVFALGAKPADLLARAQRGEEGIVVVDSIRNLGLLGADENDNAALARAVSPWIQAMRGHKTLVLTHHSRKGNGEHGEGIAGGHALLGLVDIALELRYDPAASRRLVRAYARLIQPAELMYERRQDGSMQAIGSPESVGINEVRKRVREAIDDEWLKISEVCQRLGEPQPSLRQVRNALQAEAEAGTLERDPPHDCKGKTVLWRRKAAEQTTEQPELAP
jgi:predicted ATP-dependent serine protease